MVYPDLPLQHAHRTTDSNNVFTELVADVCPPFLRPASREVQARVLSEKKHGDADNFLSCKQRMQCGWFSVLWSECSYVPFPTFKYKSPDFILWTFVFVSAFGVFSYVMHMIRRCAYCARTGVLPNEDKPVCIHSGCFS